MKKIVFYGSGNISQALISGLLSAGYKKNLIEFIDRNKINSRKTKKLGATKTNLKTIDTKSISFEGRKQLVESLPIEIVTKIRAYIKNINEYYSNVILYRVMNPHSDDKKVQTYYFNIFDNSMYEFITALLTDNLKGIYELMYVLSRRANISIESLYQHTYAEVRMYLDIYEHELKLEEEARKKEQQKNKSASPQPIGNPIDNFKP